MDKAAEIFSKMKRRVVNIKFKDLCLVCDHYFGQARQKGSSHPVYKTTTQLSSKLKLKVIINTEFFQRLGSVKIDFNLSHRAGSRLFIFAQDTEHF